MAFEDFSTYTEVDPNSKIGKGTRRITFTDIERNVLAYVNSDKGVNFFDGSFIHLITFNVSASSGNEVISPWVMSNDIDGSFDLFNPANNFSAFKVRLENPQGVFSIDLVEIDSGGNGWTSGSYTLTLGTTYYLKIVRDESVGTYGNLKCYIYDDAGRTNLLATLTITLHVSKKDFRYIFPLLSYEAGPGGFTSTGYTEDLELLSVLTEDLELANMALTDFTDTTVTGNGIIIRTGLSSVTEHGHVWATTFNPDTTDSKTTLGAGVLGVFSSSVTGLMAGQQYYIRNYATNTEGTAYGPNQRFVAGRSNLTIQAGEYSIKATQFHYVDEDGKERWLEGTLV